MHEPSPDSSLHRITTHQSKPTARSPNASVPRAWNPPRLPFDQTECSCPSPVLVRRERRQRSDRQFSPQGGWTRLALSSSLETIDFLSSDWKGAKGTIGPRGVIHQRHRPAAPSLASLKTVCGLRKNAAGSCLNSELFCRCDSRFCRTTGEICPNPPENAYHTPIDWAAGQLEVSPPRFVRGVTPCLHASGARRKGRRDSRPSCAILIGAN